MPARWPGFRCRRALLAERLGGLLVLGLGTALAGIGYLVAGASGGFMVLMVALVIGGIGSSVQHPIAANLVSQAFAGSRSRTALASYNFSGDLGKMAFPALPPGCCAMMPWRSATDADPRRRRARRRRRDPGGARRSPGRTTPRPAASRAKDAPRATGSGRGFPLLLSIAIIDSATRMGFLTFLPFLLR